MNKVILAGRLATDPEVRYTQTGKAVASFRLAVNKRFSRDQQNTADFFTIIAWQKLAEICGNNLVKGSQILVDGYLQVRNYDAQDGSKRYVTEVVANDIEFMGSRPANHADNNYAGTPSASGTSSQSTAPKNQPAASSPASSFGSELPPDEEIPF
ncbi:single-stranded DNA-binding protein [Pectinatus cerevisiiphilus]|uniref:Single-stranded DNA-binding protein n=1 Tax=Pectinatus cerevisiiphilus TaxID=86956 RepID=A0A4R3KBL5_9FIRM|nr:single-stranded DNA-binding protein [Pectinatus cerevisiiphilus]TCS80031.1 single-strand DNA-binding protein [Pectinatus cerevisiiphilus]